MSQTNFVLMIMYDVPVDDKGSQKAYRHLFNYLKKSGFYHLQSSVYLKPLSEKHKSKRYIEKIKELAVQGSHIRAFVMTYQGFMAMESVFGDDSFGERLLKQPKSVICV